jgi:hypothetical protein
MVTARRIAGMSAMQRCVTGAPGIAVDARAHPL